MEELHESHCALVRASQVMATEDSLDLPRCNLPRILHLYLQLVEGAKESTNALKRHLRCRAYHPAARTHALPAQIHVSEVIWKVRADALRLGVILILLVILLFLLFLIPLHHLTAVQMGALAAAAGARLGLVIPDLLAEPVVNAAEVEGVLARQSRAPRLLGDRVHAD